MLLQHPMLVISRDKTRRLKARCEAGEIIKPPQFVK